MLENRPGEFRRPGNIGIDPIVSCSHGVVSGRTMVSVAEPDIRGGLNHHHGLIFAARLTRIKIR